MLGKGLSFPQASGNYGMTVMAELHGAVFRAQNSQWLLSDQLLEDVCQPGDGLYRPSKLSHPVPEASGNCLQASDTTEV